MKIKKDIGGGKKFTVRTWKEPEGGYGGQCTELPGAISQGETLKELRENMTEAVQLVLEADNARRY